MEEKNLSSNENSENKTTEKKQGLFSKIMSFFKTHPTIAEVFRFLIVGGLATLIDMFAMGIVLYIFQPQNYPSFLNVFYGATQSPSTISTVLGTGIGFLVGLLFNYIFSIIFVFKTKGNSKTAKGFLLFSLLSAIGLGIHLLGMFLGYNLLGINEWLVKIFLTIVVLVYNYLTRKFFIFRNKQNTNNTTKNESNQTDNANINT